MKPMLVDGDARHRGLRAWPSPAAPSRPKLKGEYCYFTIEGKRDSEDGL